jgi:hypothetical protein
MKLDAEEKELLDSAERGEWKSANLDRLREVRSPTCLTEGSANDHFEPAWVEPTAVFQLLAHQSPLVGCLFYSTGRK